MSLRKMPVGCAVAVSQVFLTESYLGIVMEYVNGGDMADLVDTWNSRNRRRRPPGTAITPGSTQCAFSNLQSASFCIAR